MATFIHPSAVIAPGVDIGQDAHIGPFTIIEKGASIGDRSWLQGHALIGENTRVGQDCRIFAFASVGNQSQDLKWKPGNQCFTSIGDRTLIRENVTIHAGTDDGTWTKIGNDCALLALSHVGHNCEVGDHSVLSHSSTLGGHVIVEDHCNIGGLSAVHQFCRLGRFSMVAGMARVVQDILPYMIAEGTPGIMRVVNKVGMDRNGLKDHVRPTLEAFKILFRRGLTLEEATNALQAEFGADPCVQDILRFLPLAKRGLARPPAE